MGRIFISVGHRGRAESGDDWATLGGETTESQEMTLLRDLIVSEFRSRQQEVLAVPNDLSLAQAIVWINSRAQMGDIALEIHTDAFSNPLVQGTSVFYIANNSQRKQHAEMLLLGLLRRVPQLINRGAKPDTTSETGSLPFCRRLILPSLRMEIGFLTSSEDRFLIQNRQRDMTVGITHGLVAWSDAISGSLSASPAPSFPPCMIHLNGQIYGEQGLIVNGNACIPVDLVDRLGISRLSQTEVRRISYRHVVYVRAIDLRDFYISVSWDNANQTVFLRSDLPICAGQIDRIASHGNTTEVQLMMFLKMNNEAGLAQFPDLARFYREEGNMEGINYDIAFSQMCVETNFLRFGKESKPTHHNFGGLGGGGEALEASFPSVRVGVRAQIQHLKAYANTEPLVQEIVDPRFQFVTRGIVPLVGQLGGRWSADRQYGDRIMAILKRLYETSGLL
ncbi:MAG: N-acetylmuramoyl-L-alanine amidase [Kovacikia sp.]